MVRHFTWLPPPHEPQECVCGGERVCREEVKEGRADRSFGGMCSSWCFGSEEDQDRGSCIPKETPNYLLPRVSVTACAWMGLGAVGLTEEQSDEIVALDH